MLAFWCVAAMLPTLPHYVVHRLTPPRGWHQSITVPDSGVMPNMRPQTADLGRDGSLAVVIERDSGNGKKLFVRKPDGRGIVLSIPDDAVLRTRFHNSVGPSQAEGTFPNVAVTAVRVATDGTPLISVESSFTGAYGGTEASTFIWYGKRWTSAPGIGRPPLIDVKERLGAVGGPSRIAYTVNHTGFPDFDRIGRDPQYESESIVLVDRRSVTSLGYGEALGASSRYVAGFRPGLYAVAPSSPLEYPAITALVAGGSTVRQVGRGLAQAVNDRGWAVGDDRARLTARDGVPMLWVGGTGKRLASEHGTAFAIDEFGLVVGVLDSGGFAATYAGAQLTMCRLDDLMQDRSWHVEGAYGLDDHGDVLAIAERSHGAPEVVLLLPSQWKGRPHRP